MWFNFVAERISLGAEDVLARYRAISGPSGAFLLVHAVPRLRKQEFGGVFGERTVWFYDNITDSSVKPVRYKKSLVDVEMAFQSLERVWLCEFGRKK